MKKLTSKFLRKGITLIELVITMTIMGIVLLAVANSFLFLNKQSVQTQERSFAAQKAIQMMEELRGLIANRNDVSIGILDDYDDGASYSYVLTTRKSITDPADILSGNPKRKYMRRVTILMLPNEPLARQVFVRVYSAATQEAYAETVSVIRTISNQFQPSQVFDVYVISIENVPGWWVSLSSMKPTFDNIIQDLQTRNPGLEWRTHWVTRLAYGRDPFYTPYINAAVETNITAPPWVYFYPGLMDKPSVGDFLYYVPDFIAGRINVDGTVINPNSYSIADQYNHAVRYPEEETLYNQQVAAATAAGDAVPEMSLRMLLEKMNTGVGDVENLLLVNLHGELIPFPSMRNYSDPAKDPAGSADVRVVTHPERLQYASGSQVNFRVYGYVNNPDSVAQDTVLSTMTVLLTNANLTSGNLSIRKCIGNGGVAYQWLDAVYGMVAGPGVDYTISHPDANSTLITLYKTPLRHAANAGQGVYHVSAADTRRLYGLEYIPCLVANLADFQEGQRDLTTTDGATRYYKNAARWVIRVNAGFLGDDRFTIETRMDDDSTTGTAANEPYNLSKTYVWVGQTPPVTEQYQFMGDPRHMPYADVKTNLGYNWYFCTFDNATYFPGFTERADRWNSVSNVDIARYFQMYRRGLIASSGFWTSMTGYSNYYIGLGGEMGYDSDNQFPNGLPIIRTPWAPTDGSVGNINEIVLGDTPYNEQGARLISNTANTWWGLFWLGELFPDSAYATWTANGNLPTGAGNYYRAKYNAKGFASEPFKRTNNRGCSSFFNGNLTGAGNTYFNHEYWDTNIAVITNPGLTVSQDFNFPLLGSMGARRPFRLDSGGNQPPEWTRASYSAQRTTLSTLENFYEAQGNESTHDSSAIIRVKLGTDVGTVLMNGLSPQTQFGPAQISKLCVLDLIRGYMSSGGPAILTDRVVQVPLVNISSPTSTDTFDNPSSVLVEWNASWTRWDSKKYTESYAAGFSETANLVTNVKYSNDNGKNWFFAVDDSPAEAGVRNAVRNSFSPMTWNVSAKPRGNYIIRVEVYRDIFPLHYTYHQRQIYIKR